MTPGYMGKLAFVDLSTGTIRIETLADDLARSFIGGYGLGARILFEQQTKAVDPLGPENILGFATGPLTGTKAPTGALVVTPRLRRRPGPVVTSYSTSGMVEALARSHGQRVVRGPVGESQIVDLGLAEGAVLAGEGSGGVAVLPLSVAYDGLLALGLVLEELATSGRTLAELAGGFPRLFMRKRELPCPPSLVYKVIDRFRRHHAGDAPDCTDGVRLSWDDAWLHVRASGTEPLLRIIAEAPTRGARRGARRRGRRVRPAGHLRARRELTPVSAALVVEDRALGRARRDRRVADPAARHELRRRLRHLLRRRSHPRRHRHAAFRRDGEAGGHRGPAQRRVHPGRRRESSPSPR